MSDGKKISKKNLSKEDIKRAVLLVAIVGIAIGIPHLPYNNIFMAFLGLWLAVLDLDLMMLQFIYIAKDGLQSPNPKRRRHAIKAMKLMAAIAYIITAIGIFEGGRIFASYLIYLRAATSGLTKVSAPMMSQEAILILLLLVMLLPLAYVVRRETKKAIRLGMENVEFNSR
jgi:uncharacterized membrane protein YidH (DUF202 family)